MLVKVTDGKRLHVLKHLVAHPLLDALANVDHQAVVDIGTDDTCHVKSGQPGHGLVKGREVRALLPHKRGDEIINQHHKEQRACHISQGAYDYGHKDTGKL